MGSRETSWKAIGIIQIITIFIPSANIDCASTHGQGPRQASSRDMAKNGTERLLPRPSGLFPPWSPANPVDG